MNGVHRYRGLMLGAALVFAGGLLLDRVFGPRPSVPVLLATFVPALIPALVVATVTAGGRRWSLWVSAPVSLLLWLWLVSATLLRADALASVAPSAGTVRLAAGALRDSWYVLFTTTPPVPATTHLLVAVSGLTWLVSFLTAELLARSRATLPAVGTVAAFVVFGVFATAGAVGSGVPESAAFVVMAVVLLVVRSAGERRLDVREAFSVVPLVLTAALVTALAGAFLAHAGRHSFDPRRRPAPAAATLSGLDPLDQLSAWSSTPALTLFSVQAARGQDWRLAVLDRFGGQTWNTDAEFVATGSRVPGESTADATLFHQTITIGGLTGIWVPAAARPVEVTGLAVRADPDSGTVVTPDGLRPQQRYQVLSQLPRYSVDRLRTATVAGDAPARTALQLPPGIPPVLLQTVHDATGDSGYPYEQATKLAAFLRRSETNDPTAAPGHAWGHLAYFLTVAHRGTSEQFATAFALMARSIGLPTRVVVGFTTGVALPGGGWAVRGSDALAWPEVDFAGIGWVPFAATPPAGAAGRDVSPAGSTDGNEQPDTATADVAVSTRAGVGREGTAPPRAPHTGRWWWAAPVAVVLPVAGYLALVLLPIRRARRRGDQARGVMSAWSETTRRLRSAGVPTPATATAHDTARTAVNYLGQAAEPTLLPLAELVDLVVYSGRPLRAGSADAAWRATAEVYALVRRRRGVLDHWRYRMSPAARWRRR